MAEIIYKGKFSNEMAKDRPAEPCLSSYDAETQEFINLSIAYAKKSKSNIIILKDTNDIRSEIYITLGIFFGGFKRAFLKLVMKSDDFLILPIGGDSKFSLKISANYNIICNE